VKDIISLGERSHPLSWIVINEEKRKRDPEKKR
jgi:hypothetical protein